MSRTFSTSRIQREVIQAKGQRGSNQKSACRSGHTYRRPRRSGRSLAFRRSSTGARPPIGLVATSGDMMPTMPGTNLTRDEAADPRRASSTSRRTPSTWTSRPATRPSARPPRSASPAREPGAETFADLVGATVHEITLNGEPLDPADGVRRQPDRADRAGQADNELVVRADCAYSRTGEGLHRFVDPADDRVYLYTQFEVPDARRVFTTFEQPDLKASFTFHVTAPADWKVVSNAPTPEPQALGDGDGALWSFPPTKPMSTYITALIAGEYHEVLDTYEGKHGEIPLGHYCRQSLVEHLDTDELVKITEQGFEFFEEAFDFPYPFDKYDQLYVPEYNMGAMENAGCRDAARRVPPPQPPGRARSTSSAAR